ncbi:MAG TPA: tRNA pseudouridine(13) synthase TruD [Candidatus Omnitrophica bacterium]|nr:tRNA pseudouridine(13) synthase TruD [Candidatus Omnitrophota bacterium]
MKIKVLPEDFYVEEILGTPISSKGPTGLYLLEKKGENTIELLLEISKRLRLPFSNFGYGGRKDKHAFTRQYITVQDNKKPVDIKEKNWSLTHVGYLDRPMGPDLIDANRFSIVLRGVSDQEADTAQREIPKIRDSGFANYFDDQRFGTFDKNQGFLAEKILKKHFNGALKIYLTHLSSTDDKKAREEKGFFYENWGDWQRCLQKAVSQTARSAFAHLAAKPKDFIPLLRKIPPHELTLHFSAYQGYLWNETLRRFLAQNVQGPLTHKGLAGDYIFFDILEPALRADWLNLAIPTIASKMDISDERTRKIAEMVLQENGLTTPMFNITKIRQAYFKSTQRKAVAVPEGLTEEASADDLYPGSKKMVLKFSLARGSYATMLIKRIFAPKIIDLSSDFR